MSHLWESREVQENSFAQLWRKSMEAIDREIAVYETLALGSLFAALVVFWSLS